jgi:hypothetical protein
MHRSGCLGVFACRAAPGGNGAGAGKRGGKKTCTEASEWAADGQKVLMEAAR